MVGTLQCRVGVVAVQESDLLGCGVPSLSQQFLYLALTISILWRSKREGEWDKGGSGETGMTVVVPRDDRE